MGELTDSSAPATNRAAMVEVEDLVKRYRKSKANAVDGISFSVRPGEFTVLDSPVLDLAVMAAMFAVFPTIGTALFVRSERNR